MCEAAPDEPLLRGVVQTDQPHAEAMRPEPLPRPLALLFRAIADGR